MSLVRRVGRATGDLVDDLAGSRGWYGVAGPAYDFASSLLPVDSVLGSLKSTAGIASDLRDSRRTEGWSREAVSSYDTQAAAMRELDGLEAREWGGFRDELKRLKTGRGGTVSLNPGPGEAAAQRLANHCRSLPDASARLNAARKYADRAIKAGALEQPRTAWAKAAPAMSAGKEVAGAVVDSTVDTLKRSGSLPTPDQVASQVTRLAGDAGNRAGSLVQRAGNVVSSQPAFEAALKRFPQLETAGDWGAAFAGSVAQRVAGVDWAGFATKAAPFVKPVWSGIQLGKAVVAAARTDREAQSHADAYFREGAEHAATACLDAEQLKEYNAEKARLADPEADDRSVKSDGLSDGVKAAREEANRETLRHRAPDAGAEHLPDAPESATDPADGSGVEPGTEGGAEAVEAESNPEPEVEPKPESEAQPDAEAEVASAPAESEVESGVEPEAESEAEPELEERPDVELEPGAEPDVEAGPVSRSDGPEVSGAQEVHPAGFEAETEPDPEPEGPQAPTAGTTDVPAPEPEREPAPEVEADAATEREAPTPEPEPGAEPEVASGSAPAQEAAPGPTPDPEPDVEPEPDEREGPGAETAEAPTPEMEPGAEPEVASGSAPAQEAAPGPTPDPEPDVEPEPAVSSVGAEPEATPVPEPTPDAGSTPEPEPDSQPGADVEPEATSDPTPQPEPVPSEPAPEPEPAPDEAEASL